MTALVSAMEGLMTSAETADCSVVVDGAETRCHKAVLAAASTWFHRALFEVPMREREEGVVTLKGVKLEAWECMHRFIYTRKVRGVHCPCCSRRCWDRLLAKLSFLLPRLWASGGVFSPLAHCRVRLLLSCSLLCCSRWPFLW